MKPYDPQRHARDFADQLKELGPQERKEILKDLSELNYTLYCRVQALLSEDGQDEAEGGSSV
jgi:hypothetical protein